ncbi:MAG TPA: hypothetical protein VME86_10615 [Acidobacteriaceae bacterium]|nr:hypothetical protein [Acidobacteriaceae bacterium]
MQLSAHPRRIDVLVLGVCLLASVAAAQPQPAGIRVQGPGTPPQLGFACCEHGIPEMQALFANPAVIPSLQTLRASVALPILDFSPQRAAVVHQLNQANVPVIAWIMLSKEHGFYLNADNVPLARNRITAFDQWTRANNLKWVAVGLDVEPNFAELGLLKGHPLRLMATLIRRSFNEHRIASARRAYSALIAQIRASGYPVQIYQMPYIVAERDVHSDLLDRLLGTVDVRGNQDYLMLYTSFAHPVGAAMIWSLGRNASGIAVGSTDGAATPGAAPLNWTEFSRDLIVASHFTPHIGIYDLEGCIRQGFLPRLESMDWSQSVVIPADAVARARRFGLFLRAALWVGPYLAYIILAAILLIAWLIWHWRRRRKSREISKQNTPQ